jgi:hypothetical protein
VWVWVWVGGHLWILVKLLVEISGKYITNARCHELAWYKYGVVGGRICCAAHVITRRLCSTPMRAIYVRSKPKEMAFPSR